MGVDVLLRGVYLLLLSPAWKTSKACHPLRLQSTATTVPVRLAETETNLPLHIKLCMHWKHFCILLSQAQNSLSPSDNRHKIVLELLNQITIHSAMACGLIKKKKKKAFGIPWLVSALGELAHLCESVLWSGTSAGRPMSRCCSRTCWRNSDTWYWRSSFSCRSLRCRASHRSSSLGLCGMVAAGSPVATVPGPK